MPDHHDGPSLRETAEPRRLRVGAAVKLPRRGRPEPEAYWRVLGEQFDTVVAENAMKPRWTQPERGQFDFTAADPMTTFAAQHGQAVRGHTLAWHSGIPDWMKELDPQQDAIADVLRDHVHGVADRYRGRVFAWDVINEVFDKGGWRDTLWRRALGDDLLPSVFRWAHEHAPDAELFYNDYGIEKPGWKIDATLAEMRRLLDLGVPLHGVGLQCHHTVHDAPTESQLADVIGRIVDLGLKVHLTEIDIRVPTNDGPATTHYDQQAEVFGRMIRTAVAFPAMDAVLFWGFTDRHSWVPSFFEGWGDALLFDANFEPKPAYFAVREAITTRPPAG
ncbi:MAG: endo-1,4-beta-xylanase [Planctomycetota bacterium]